MTNMKPLFSLSSLSPISLLAGNISSFLLPREKTRQTLVASSSHLPFFTYCICLGRKRRQMNLILYIWKEEVCPSFSLCHRLVHLSSFLSGGWGRTWERRTGQQDASRWATGVKSKAKTKWWSDLCLEREGKWGGENDERRDSKNKKSPEGQDRDEVTHHELERMRRETGNAWTGNVWTGDAWSNLWRKRMLWMSENAYPTQIHF